MTINPHELTDYDPNAAFKTPTGDWDRKKAESVIRHRAGGYQFQPGEMDTCIDAFIGLKEKTYTPEESEALLRRHGYV